MLFVIGFWFKCDNCYIFMSYAGICYFMICLNNGYVYDNFRVTNIIYAMYNIQDHTALYNNAVGILLTYGKHLYAI